MITLFCDLDNTIIFSHRKELNTSKRVAELLNGVEQGYITEKTFNFLSSCRSISFVPVTTRTLQQYERVESTIQSFNSKYALILNGAILLKNGAVDDMWLNESRELVKDATDEMNKAAALLNRYCKTPLRYRDDFLIYSSVKEPKAVAEKIQKDIDSSQLNVFFDSRKVYCAPLSMNKGNNVRRFRRYHQTIVSIGVGDSKNDLSMLEGVDIPILPQSLSSFVSNPQKIEVPDSKVLSDAACDEIELILTKYNGMP